MSRMNPRTLALLIVVCLCPPGLAEYLGSWKIDDYVGIPVTTHRFSSGAAYAPSSLTYSIYEDGSTTGIDEDVSITVGSPFDSITGCYYVRRQLTSAAGFEKGKNYLVVVKATVDDVSGVATHTFQIQSEVDARSVSAQNVSANVEQWKGSTAPAMTGDAYARLGSPAGASVSADLAAVAAVTTKVNTMLTADGANYKFTPAALQEVSVGDIDVNDLRQSYWDPATDPVILTSDYDAAKTAAQAGDAMDLVGAPNATAIAAIQSGLPAAVVAAWLAEEVDGITMNSLIEAQIADLVGRVTVGVGDGTRTYTYYRQDGKTVIMSLTSLLPYGDRTTTGTIVSP